MSEYQHVAVRVIISGRVQGVWYRNWTIGEATARGLDGWVRNRRDGTVEALFSGAGTVIRDMIAACHDGPPLAKVLSVEEHAESALRSGSGFTKRGSA